MFYLQVIETDWCYRAVQIFGINTVFVVIFLTVLPFLLSPLLDVSVLIMSSVTWTQNANKLIKISLVEHCITVDYLNGVNNLGD